MRKKIARLWNEKLGPGKKSIEGSEEDFTPHEVIEVFRRLPPTVSIESYQIDEEGRRSSVDGNGINSVKANGDQAAEFINTALEASQEIREDEFTVPHRENMRGTVELRDGFIGGTHTVETGDNNFEYEINVQVDKEVETLYEDSIPKGTYTIVVRSSAVDDETIDAALGNIESISQSVRVSENELVDYLTGQEGQVSGRDQNLDPMVARIEASSNMTVHEGMEGYLEDAEGDETAEFVEQTSEGYDQPWSGVIYETETGNTGIWHMSIPGSKDTREETKSEISGQINQNYEISLEKLS